MRIYLNQLWMGLKLYTRMPAAVFWLFAFPIIMLLGMGTVFGNRAETTMNLVWSQEADPSAADQLLLQAFTERRVAPEILVPAEAEQRWRSGKLAAMLIEGADGKVALRLNSYLTMQGMQAEAVVQQAFLMARARAQGASNLDRIPVIMASPGGHGGGPYAAYLLPGLLGLNLLMLGVFSTGMVDVTMRERGGYKRLATTPLPRSLYLAAQISVRLIIISMASILLMLAGALVFGIYNQGSYATLFLLMLCGAACFISMGYVLGSLARSVESYGGIANLVFLPMMLLSGVYFSLDAAPAWLQKAASLLPLSPLLKAMRAVFNDGASFATQAPLLAIVAGWTVILFALAVRRFRWV